MARARRKSAVRGAAAVEFALVLFPLLLIVLGTIDYGYYFYVRQVVVNAAREGARFGSISLDENFDDRRTAAVAAANAYLDRLGFQKKATPCNTDKALPPIVVPDHACCVEVSYPLPNKGSVTGFLTGVIPKTATARAQMHLEGTTAE